MVNGMNVRKNRIAKTLKNVKNGTMRKIRLRGMGVMGGMIIMQEGMGRIKEIGRIEKWKE